MPRQLLDIKTFNAGIICAPDVEDLPDNAAQTSLDLSADLGMGTLIGRYSDLEKTYVGGSAMALSVKRAAFIRADVNKYDLIYHDATNNYVRRIKDFYTAPALDASNYISVTGKEINLLAHNKEVRVAQTTISTGVVGTPQRMGYVEVPQFGVALAADPFSVTSCELIPPDVTPNVDGNAGDGTYVYSATAGGNVVFRSRVSDGVGDAVSPVNEFSGIFGVAMLPSGHSLQSTRFLVFDRDETYGTVHFVDKTSLRKVFSCPLAFEDGSKLEPSTNGATTGFTDFVCTDNKIWFATQSSGHYDDEGGAFFFNCDILTVTSGKMLSLKSVSLAHGTDNNASFVNADGDLYHRVAIETSMTYPLVKIDGTHVGMAVRITSWDNAQGNVYWKDESAVTHDIEGVVSIYACDEAGTDKCIINTGLLDIGNLTGIQYEAGALFYSSGATLGKLTLSGNLFSSEQYGYGMPNTSAIMTKPGRLTSSNSTNLYVATNGEQGGAETYLKSNLSTAPSVYISGGSMQLSVSTSSQDGGFADKSNYFYKICFGYDGYQYSPLCIGTKPIRNPEGDFTGKMIRIRLADKTTLSARVSHIHLFRATGPLGASIPSTQYRLVSSFDLGATTWDLTASPAATVTFVDNMGDSQGSTYDDLTGISETLFSNFVSYGVIAEQNGCTFVGRCSHASIPDASHMIFRSRPGRPDMFNWITEFVYLPTIPLAMQAFAGRLFVFDEQDCYKIDPENMFIEDVYRGYGTFNQSSVCLADKVMVVLNANNIYIHDGQDFRSIGDPIRSSLASVATNAGVWTNIDLTVTTPKVSYQAQSQYIVITFYRFRLKAFAFHIPTKRWDIWTVPDDSSDNPGLFGGKDGELYYSSTAKLYTLNNPTVARKAWSWTSKIFDFDEPGQYKKIYWVKPDTGADTVTVYYDDSENNVPTTAIASLTGSKWKRKHITVRVIGDATGYLRALEIVYRLMIGKR